MFGRWSQSVLLHWQFLAHVKTWLRQKKSAGMKGGRMECTSRWPQRTDVFHWLQLKTAFLHQQGVYPFEVQL